MDLHLNLLRQQQQYLLLLNQQRGLVNTRFKQGPILGSIPAQQPLINPLNIQHKIASNLQNPLLKPKLVPKNILPQTVNVPQLNPHTHAHHHHRQQPTQHPMHQHPHHASQQHMPHHNAHHNHLISQHTKHHNHNNNNNNHNQINQNHHNNQHGNYFHAVAQHHADAINNTNKLTNHHSNNNNHISIHNNNNHNNISHHPQNSNINSNYKNSSAFHIATKISSNNNNSNHNKNFSMKHNVTTVKPSTTPSANNNHNNANNNHSTLLNQSSRYSKANAISTKIDATERFDVPKISSKNLNPPTSIVTDTVTTAKAPLKRPYVPDNDDKKINGVYKLLNGAITGKIRSPSNINSSTPYSENLKPPPINKTYFNDNSDISDGFSSESETIRGNDFGSCKVRKSNYFDDNYALKISDHDTTGKNSSCFDDDTLDGIENYKIAESTRKSVVYPQLSKNALRPSNTVSNLNNSSLLNKTANKSLVKSQTSKLANKFANYNANYKENTPGIRRFGVVNEKNLNKLNLNHSQNSTLDQVESYRPSYTNNTMSGFNPNGYIRKLY